MASELLLPRLVACVALLAACSSSSGGGRTCFRDDECLAGRVCSAQGRCVEGVRPPADGGLADGGADAGAPPIDAGTAPDSGVADAGNGCTMDAQCGAPANICVSQRCVAGCQTTGCGSGRACDTATGRCGNCNNDRECGAPDAVCDNGTCVPGCGVVGCAQRNATCSAASGRCSACASDLECSAPSTICDQGGCVPGCLSAGCGGSGSCNASTGRCGAAAADGGANVGSGMLGADCQTDGDCANGKCLELSVAGRPFKVCSRLCCTESDCPPRDSGGNGVGCIEFYGANFCLTDRIFAGTGVKLERGTGQACGPGASDNWCRSGLCRQNSQGQRTCQSTCCSNGDCGAFTCAFRPGYSPGEVAHHVCEVDRFLLGRTNDPCTSELECSAFMCIPLGSQPFCTDTCCSARDCPSGWMCMQIESGQERYSNLGMGCIPNLGGTAGAGSPCTPGSFPNECASGVCASGTCRDTCCYDAQCPVGTVCRAVDNGEPLSGLTRTGLVRVCLPQ